MKGLNFHCFMASAAALARTGSPLTSSTVSTSPISETTALTITLPCTFWDRAADGYSGLTFLTNSRTVESGGAGGLLTFGESALLVGSDDVPAAELWEYKGSRNQQIKS